MKLRETYLKSLIHEMFGEGNKEEFKFSYNQLSTKGKAEMMKVYKSLGGVLSTPPSRFGAWDIVSPSLIIELDEEQHFNRYRQQTLNSLIYVENSIFSEVNYKDYCVRFEVNCLKKATFGKYWTSPSTEKQFGIAGIKGDFSKEGSPRWKQRAFYDFCRDLYARDFGFKVVRFSIYGKVTTDLGLVDLGIALERGLKTDVIKFLKGVFDGK
jgi:hypothetical protein